MSSPTELGFDKLQTGDILLFKGNAWYSRAIEWLGRSPYSHVGIVLKDPICINPELTGYYVFESGFGFGNDVDGKDPVGVQLNRLTDVLARYEPGQVYVRHLAAERNAHFNDTIRSIYESGKGMYDIYPLDWIEAKVMLDDGLSWAQCLFPWNDVRKTSTFWCSAFVTFAYSRLGLVEDPGTLPWTLITPSEWSSVGGKILRLRDCSLSEEIQLQWTPK